MRKRIATIALVAALAASQAVISYAANSPGTGPVIGGGDSDYDIGERVDRVLGKGTVGTAQGVNTVQISKTGITTNSKGQVIVGDTALELIAGDERAEMCIRDSSGSPLNGVVPGTNLEGYSALISTHAIVTKDAATDTEKAGMVEVPLYVPNLVDGLGEVQVLFYNNLTGTWTVIQPNRVDAASKTIWFNIPNSGTLSVIYKR